MAGELRRAIEALIFAADEPVPPARIAEVYAEVTGEELVSDSEIEEVVEELNAAYAAQGHVFQIQTWGGGLRLSTVETVGAYLEAFFRRDKMRRISRQLMETLAIVGYRQPVTKAVVDYVRGVNSDYTLRKLLELGLIDVVGRGEDLGQPMLYGTSARFMEVFGLKDLSELPNLREIKELLDDPEFSEERARLLMHQGLAPEESSQESES